MPKISILFTLTTSLLPRAAFEFIQPRRILEFYAEYNIKGYIQITLPGGFESKKGLIDATQDENTVMFVKKDNELVNRIKSKIEELLAQQRAYKINQLSPADEIKKYKELLDDGIITQEEFEKKKKQLLGL